jgi:nitrogen fixation-related uncharacterized protein
LFAVKSGQFKDTYTPSIRILLDDKEKNINENNSGSNKGDTKWN